MIRWKRSWPELPENLPVDVMPNSNGEFIPLPPTHEQRAIMDLAGKESDRWAKKMGMPRRQFLRTAAAWTVGFWAINQIRGSKFGWYANAMGDPACENLNDPGSGEPYQLNNLPGEWIFDIQTHHVDSAGQWRVTNPAIEAFFAAIWSQSSPAPGLSRHKYDKNREVDPIEYLSQYYYLKEIFLDSATSAAVLSAVPSSQELNPLPTATAAATVHMVNQLAGSTEKNPRSVMHAFVMPNYGSAGTTTMKSGPEPAFMKQEFHHMDLAADRYGDILRAWKVYTPWGDIPYASGWFLDDRVGRQFCEKVIEVGNRTGVPKTICCHKGFALPAFDQRAASPKDIGPVAKEYHEEGLTFIVYHSGYTGGTSQLSTQVENGDGEYPGDDAWDSAKLGTNSLIKSLRENGWSARHFAPGGTPGLAGVAGDGDPDQHGNVPNVFAEIGSAWSSVFHDPEAAAHMLLKLIYYVGPKRVVWGTDSLWFGSPQTVIAALRTYEPSQEMKAKYRLPFGLEGDVENPLVKAPSPSRTIRNAIFGRNAAVPYRMDPDAQLNAIACDKVQDIRNDYLINP
ncbi:MAG: hypothetical protein WAT66_11505, partial [Actinomycetota bacterium]